jgi:hypothetical protein
MRYAASKVNSGVSLLDTDVVAGGHNTSFFAFRVLSIRSISKGSDPLRNPWQLNAMDPTQWVGCEVVKLGKTDDG